MRSSNLPLNRRVTVICLPIKHQGVHRNSFRSVRAFQIELEFGLDILLSLFSQESSSSVGA